MTNLVDGGSNFAVPQAGGQDYANSVFQTLLHDAVTDQIMVRDLSNPAQPKYYLSGAPMVQE